jgi:WD40 repeat protein
VVIGGGDGRVLVWDPAVPGVGPAELGRHSASQVLAVAVLPGGRVVTAGEEGRVLVWDPATPGAHPAELGGYHWGGARALAVLPDGRVVTGGADRRVLLRDPARASTQVIQLNCSLTTLATASPSPPRSTLAIAHQGGGLSLWSVTG